MPSTKRIEAPRSAFLDLLSGAMSYAPNAFDVKCKRALRLTSKATKSIVDDVIDAAVITTEDMAARKITKFNRTGWTPRLHHLMIRGAGEKELKALKKIQLPELRRLEVMLLNSKATKPLVALPFPQLTRLDLVMRPTNVTDSVFTPLLEVRWPLVELNIGIDYDRFSHRWQQPDWNPNERLKLQADKEIARVPGNFPQLRVLKMWGVSLDLEDIKALTNASLLHLERLILEEDPFGGTVPRAIETISAGNWPKLQDLTLNFSFHKAVRKDAEALAGVSWFRNLKSLILDQSRLSRSIFRTLLDALKGSGIEKLHLGDIGGDVLNELHDADLPMLRQFVVKELGGGEERGEDYLDLELDGRVDVDGERIFDEEDEAHVGISAIFRSPIAKTLQVLSIDWLGSMEVTPCVWRGVAPNEDLYTVLYGDDWQLPNLRIVLLKGFQFEVPAMLRIGRCFARSPHLERICLGGHVVSNGLAAFVAGLPQSAVPPQTPVWPRLTRLEFPVVQDFDEGRLINRSDLSIFLRAAKHFPALKVLVLETGGQLRIKEGRALAQAAAEGAFPSLEYLSISGMASAARGMLEAGTPLWPLRTFAIVNDGAAYLDDGEMGAELSLQLQNTFPHAALFRGHPSYLVRYYANEQAQEDSKYKDQGKYLNYYEFGVE